MAPTSAPLASVEAAILETLAHALEFSERRPGVMDADRYRSLVARLRLALRQASSDIDLSALLAAYPATAEVYENMNYEVAGLCRSPLEAALRAELQARDLIERVGRRAG